MLLDAAMHYVWNQNSSFYEETTYQQYIDKIKITPRIWNSKTKLSKVLQHISWTLNLNINILGLKRSRDHTKCLLHSTCYYLYYIFQNPLIKLLRSNHRTNTVNVLICKQHYYIIPNTSIIPRLTKALSTNCVTFQNINVTHDSILQIIQSKLNIHLPFNVTVYSAFQFANSTRAMTHYPIGQYKQNCNKDMLHLFISPHLVNLFNIHILTNVTNNLSQKHNIFLNHIKEGKYLNLRSSQPKVLNQEHCICEHSETQRVLMPSANSFKPLASKQLQKYFLYENLKTFGILTSTLDQRLQICCKLSFLSFDTEALNKSLLPSYIDNVSENEFINDFTSVYKKKVSYAVQQLYTIGKNILDPPNCKKTTK